ncbi:hypothetical protein ACE6H2_012084 [Prunus campanulata]
MFRVFVSFRGETLFSKSKVIVGVSKQHCSTYVSIRDWGSEQCQVTDMIDCQTLGRRPYTPNGVYLE